MRVEIVGLRFERARRVILDIPSLMIRPGKVTAILGKNGAGKSTLLRLIAGLETPSAGLIEIDADGVAGGDANHKAARIAFAFQDAVFFRRSVRANLQLALEIRGVSATERSARIERVAKQCGITEILERQADTLSGGEARRANIARALALESPLLLLDEPLSGLDLEMRAPLLGDLAEWIAMSRSTVILVTHEPAEAEWLAEDLVILEAGRVLCSGDLATLMARPPDPQCARLLGMLVVECAGGQVAFERESLSAGTTDGAIALDMVVHRHAGSDARQRIFGRIGRESVAASWPESEMPPARGATVIVRPARALLYRALDSAGGWSVEVY